MPFLKKVPIQQKLSTKRGAISNRLRKDKTKGEKLFHFQLINTKTTWFLFNSNRQLIKKFNRTGNDVKDKREIRQFALQSFLEFEGSQLAVGGFTFDD